LLLLSFEGAAWNADTLKQEQQRPCLRVAPEPSGGKMNTDRHNLMIEACWRSAEFLFMLAIGYIITRSPIYASAIALVDIVTKLVLSRVKNRPSPQ
jgi:hypothetical protein